MTRQLTRISAIFAQVQTTSQEVQEAVIQAIGSIAYNRGTAGYPVAAENTTQALEKALKLLEQLRALHCALSNVKRVDA
jgi:hypothetical protein